jgi:hypothetical protein
MACACEFCILAVPRTGPNTFGGGGGGGGAAYPVGHSLLRASLGNGGKVDGRGLKGILGNFDL